MRVLIAEDEAKTRGKLVEIVLSLGCEPIVASSGLEAIRLVRQHRPEILLLDGLLPELHGFEITRYVRSLAPEYHPRIVIVTAIYRKQHYQHEAMRQFGADAYVMKPVTHEAIKTAIFPDAERTPDS